MRHPTYPDGSPVLVGDVVDTDEHYGHFKDKGCRVAEIHWNRIQEEAWIMLYEPGSPFSSSACVFKDGDLRRAEEPRPRLSPAQWRVLGMLVFAPKGLRTSNRSNGIYVHIGTAESLERLGLVERHTGGQPFSSGRYRLTEKGLRVAEGRT